LHQQASLVVVVVVVVVAVAALWQEACVAVSMATPHRQYVSVVGVVGVVA